jgi:hypothetical protein
MLAVSNNCLLRNELKMRALPIGGMLSLSSAPMCSDKIRAFKQNSDTIFVASNIDAPFVCIVDDNVHNFMLAAWHVYYNIPTDASNITASLFIDYTSYCQVD